MHMLPLLTKVSVECLILKVTFKASGPLFSHNEDLGVCLSLHSSVLLKRYTPCHIACISV